MAEIVGGFIIPHAPHMVAAPERAAQKTRESCWAAFDTVTRRIKELEVDTVIVIGDDHYSIHSPQCIPSVLIAIGDVEGPVEPWLNVPTTRIENNPELALHIAKYGFENGVDWAVAKAMVLDHSTYVPYHYAVKPVDGLKMVPIYVNSGVEPFISTKRCYEVGQNIARAVAAFDRKSRVAIYGTGGFSHWPGLARMGDINVEFDHQLLKYLEAGDVDALISLNDNTVYDDAGNGALELKNWVVALGAMGDCKGEVIAYEAMFEWVCGCGYVELKMAA